MSIDALIVGAGPVGLWTGMCMKANDPTARVVAVDQYVEYKRDNPLILQRNSLDNIPQNPTIQALVDKIFIHNGGKVTTVHIQTSKIEEMFLKAAQER